MDQRTSLDAAPDTLNCEQRDLFDLVVDHFRCRLQYERATDQRISQFPFEALPEAPYGHPMPKPQLLINLDGKAGTGKSYVIHMISAKLEQLASEEGRSTLPIIRAAPTGVAAFNINGQTLHRLLHIKPDLPKGPYLPLSAASEKRLQEKLAGVYWLIIDEKSMIGLRMLHWVDIRCRQAFPHRHQEPFGGLNVILAGDFFQLPPVRARSLYHPTPEDSAERSGAVCYRQFTKTVELMTPMRQQGTDPIAIQFRDALDRLRVKEATIEDWHFFSRRLKYKLPRQEIDQFDSALRLFYKAAPVIAFNHKRIRDLQRPVIPIIADNAGPDAHKAGADNASNLANELFLCLDCRVMLRENVWTETGLVNGAFGTLRGFLWPVGTSSPRTTCPLALLVEFDSYTGPRAIDTGEDGPTIVPIFRCTRDFDYNKKACSRTQFPVVAAYAMTVHKAQGLSLDRVVVNIKEREHSTGLHYVAISRARSFNGIMIEEPFPITTIRPAAKSSEMQRRIDEQDRRRQEVVCMIFLL